MTELIQNVIDYANTMHKGQYRKGGAKLPYIVHPIDVLNRLHRWGIVEPELLAAGVLHDIIEDCGDSLSIQKTIWDQFGPIAHDYVVEMTCIGQSKEAETV